MRWPYIVALIGLWACGDGTGSLPDDTSSGGDGQGGSGGTTPVVSSSSTGGGNVGPATSCEDAPLMGQNDLGYWVDDNVVVPKGGSAFLKFELDRTGWFTAFNAALSDADLVMMLRDENGDLVAVVDDTPRIALGYPDDAQISYFAEAQGVYCLELKTYEAFEGNEGPEVGPFQVGVLDPLDFEFVTQDEGNNDTTATAQEMTTDGLILGAFDGPGDIDVYRLTLPPNAPFGIVAIDPGGPGESTWFEGSGSADQGTITVLASDGSTALTRGRFGDFSSTCVGPATCELVFDPAGETDFFVVFEGPADQPLTPRTYYAVAGYGDFFKEEEPAGDEADTLNDVPAAAIHQPEARLVGELHDGDVDWWRIGDASDATVTGVFLVCSGRAEGGGLVDMRVEVYSAESQGQGEPVASFVETATERLHFSPAPLAQRPPLPGGEYLLRVTASGVDPEVANRHYSCDVHLNRQAL